MQPIYAERIVAFIDILGFSVLVRQIGEEPSLHVKLHHALTQIKQYKHNSLRGNTAQSELEVSVFSDSIVISGAFENINGIIWSVIHLQCQLLVLGILIRGGISSGRTFHADDILYGEGMLDAYFLESKAAIYPRIVLAPHLVNKMEPVYRAVFLSQDIDGLWFINPFSMGLLSGDVEALLEDGYDPHEESLKSLGSTIDHELSQLSDVSHLAKWQWLKSQHDKAVMEITRLGKPRYWHILEAVEKTK